MRQVHSRETERHGFTLIELLVVMLIIGILVGMLLPAIQIAKQAALRATAINDIAQLSTAIANAKSTMNARYVPATLILNGASTIDPGLQQFFNGRFNPANCVTVASSTPFDGNQCLVFYLGGVTMAGTSPTGSISANFTGFAQSVTNPFQGGGSRFGPFYDFPQNRINSSGQFTDPWGTPYVYMTTVNGNGDYAGNYTLPSNITVAGGLTLAPYYYPNPTGGAVTVANIVNPNGFQIISAGPPQQQPGGSYGSVFGPGGLNTSTNPTTSNWAANGYYSAGTPGAPNLSNFNAGPLKMP